MTALLKGYAFGQPIAYLRNLWRGAQAKAGAKESYQIESFEDLYGEQLQDMHSCERQLTGAWARLADEATHPQLKVVLADLVGETQRHLGRLHRILEDLDTGPHRAVCRVTSAVIAEGCAAVGNGPRGAVCDARILCAGQKLQHHQIATYASLNVLAQLLARRSDQNLLAETLREENVTQVRFTGLSAAYVAVLTFPVTVEVQSAESAKELKQKVNQHVNQEVLAHA